VDSWQFEVRNRRFTITVQTGKIKGPNILPNFEGALCMSKSLLLTAGTLSLVLLSASLARGAEVVSIQTDHTILIEIPGNPGTVVVGNPSIADATVHGNKLFVHGRAFGSTNIIVLDQSGAQVADLQITTKVGGSDNVAVFRWGQRASYVCAPTCELAMQPGDEPFTITDDIIKLNGKKAALAKGEATTPAAAPPPPQ
jgi:Pilus formation protein N terminal region